jgi:hypothetical protein
MKMSDGTSANAEQVGFQISANSTPEKKSQVSIQELVDSLKSIQDDIGQISELTSEEELLITEFFASLLRLMQPFTQSITVDPSVLPVKMGTVIKSGLDASGQLTLLYEDGRMELKDLSDPKLRDLMIAVIEDVIPKFKQFPAAHKSRIETRIKFLSAITREMQRISEALFPHASSESQK